MAYYISNIARSKGDPKILHSGPSSLGAADRMAKALGWFSIGLGLTELIAAELGRVQRPVQLGPAGPLLDRGHEVLDHRQVDVGLEQRHPDLPGGGVDVGLGEPALAAEVLERRGEAVLQGVEHGGVLRWLS